MTVAITAIFPTLAAAESAAGCIAVCPDRGSLKLSLEHCDHNTGAATATSRMIHGMRFDNCAIDSTPTCEAASHRATSAILRVRCSEQLSAFVTRELAALGAEKISISTFS